MLRAVSLVCSTTFKTKMDGKTVRICGVETIAHIKGRLISVS